MADFRLGYVAHSLTLGLTASHTCRLVNATPARLATEIARNLEELEKILLFNEANGIEVFRIGSSLIPLASHRANRTRWWQTFRADLEALGRIAARSRQRLSLHPGPEAASLSSARPIVRTAAIRELRYATRLLDLLGQGPDGRVVLHVGGAAPDRGTALSNAHRLLDRMPDDARRRLAIEHDDYIWPAREVLPLATEHGLPLLADNLHNALLPSTPKLNNRQLFALSAGTFEALGLRPKFHVAFQRPDARPGAHSNRVPLEEFLDVLSAVRGRADLMLEAKDKDLALLELRAGLAKRGIYESTAMGAAAYAANAAATISRGSASIASR